MSVRLFTGEGRRRACERERLSLHGLSASNRSGAQLQHIDVELSGPSRSYVREAEEGRKLNNHFCPSCGTTVYWTLDLCPDLYGIGGGLSMEQRCLLLRIHSTSGRSACGSHCLTAWSERHSPGVLLSWHTAANFLLDIYTGAALSLPRKLKAICWSRPLRLIVIFQPSGLDQRRIIPAMNFG